MVDITHFHRDFEENSGGSHLKAGLQEVLCDTLPRRCPFMYFLSSACGKGGWKFAGGACLKALFLQTCVAIGDELDKAAAGCVGAPEGVNLGFKIDKVGFNLRKAADRHAVAVSYWEKSVECFRANSCLPHSYNFDFSHGGGKNVFACAAVFTSNQALWSMPQETSLILGNILP